ncbi:MAG: response regulator transcription factor [Ignavibacteria bacterium]|nr:response regulator transcription factor [Ignavibacteria bacterium]
MKIIIADDHAVVRVGLKDIVRRITEVDLIEESDNGLDALEKIKKGNFDLAILDLSMPKLSGLEILNSVKNIKLNTKFLILSIHPQAQYAIRALKAGASGYLSKDSVYDELIKAINKILNGGKYISADLAEKVIFDKNDMTKLPHEKLSEREFQTMILLAKGNSVKEIANHLFLSDKTISTYRARIMEKMETKTNSELSLYALRNKLIE